MAAKYWIKLYLELLDDWKTGSLSDSAWRLMIELFLLAGEVGENGKLPAREQICWRLRLSDKDKFDADLKTLIDSGIIGDYATGLHVTNFAKRQAADSQAERVRRYRERNENVTKGYNRVNSQLPESDIESESESEKNHNQNDDDEPFDIFHEYHKIMGKLVNSPYEAEQLKQMQDTFAPDWIIDAFKVAVESNVPTIAYIKGVLAKWKEHGKGWKPGPNGNGSKPAPTSEPIVVPEGW